MPSVMLAFDPYVGNGLMLSRILLDSIALALTAVRYVLNIRSAKGYDNQHRRLSVLRHFFVAQLKPNAPPIKFSAMPTR